MRRPSARELVMTYGWNTTAYQTLNPGLQHWYAPDEPAVVAYVRRQKVMLVAGAPVCAARALGSVMAAFERFAREHGCRVCYVCAAERMRNVVAESREHSAIVIGAQPVWNPRRWAETVAPLRSMRTQLARARNKGVTIEALSRAEDGDRRELERVLEAWLKSRGLPAMRFLVEPRILPGVESDRILVVARSGRSPVAFLVASPVVERNGFLIEQIARLPHAPNGVSELLIDAAMRRFATDGRVYATLGLVALSDQARDASAINPWWLRVAMTLARGYTNRFYNFRGLERFRAKMAPSAWETIYAIANEPSFSVRTLYAIAGAFAGFSPWRLVANGLVRLLRQRSARGAAEFDADVDPWLSSEAS